MSFNLTSKKVFRLWKNIFIQSWSIILIPCIIGSIYTVLDRKGHRPDGSLPTAYWVYSELISWFGFSVIVIWPFRVCGWVSTRWAFALFGLCQTVDLTFRIGYWGLEHAFVSEDIVSTHMFHSYVATWALFDDAVSWLFVPLLVHLLNVRKNQSKDTSNNDIELKENFLAPNSSISECSNTSKLQFNTNLDNLVMSEIADSKSASFDSSGRHQRADTLANAHQRTDTIISSVISTDLKAQTSFSVHRTVSKLLKYPIIFCIAWFLCQDVYQYYTRDRGTLNIYFRFLPMIFVLIGLVTDLRESFKEKQVFFHSIWYIIGYILTQDLFVSWANLTIDLVSFASNSFQIADEKWMANAIVRVFVFMGYSLSFQLLSYIARKFAIHCKQPNDIKNKVQWDNFNSFDLQFIFIVYSEYFLFQFITISSFDSTFFMTLVAKEVFTFIKLHPVIRAKCKIFNNNAFHVWVTYVYGILISWIVLCCQMSVIWADYYQPFENSEDYWLYGNNDIKKTPINLMSASLMIIITLICNMAVYAMVYNVQIENLKSYTNKIHGIKNEIINEDHQEFLTNVHVESNGSFEQTRKRSIFLVLGNDADEDHVENVVTIGNERATGLNLYIPFHRWYYAGICSLVAIKCTEIIFTDLYNYFI